MYFQQNEHHTSKYRAYSDNQTLEYQIQVTSNQLPTPESDLRKSYVQQDREQLCTSERQCHTSYHEHRQHHPLSEFQFLAPSNICDASDNVTDKTIELIRTEKGRSGIRFQEPQISSPEIDDYNKISLTLRMTQISDNFLKLNKSQTKQAVHDLQGFYVNKSSEIECDRYSSLRTAGVNKTLLKSINIQYDERHLDLIDRVDRSISLLEKMFEKPSREIRKHSTLGMTKISGVAIDIMTTWYNRNSEHPYPGYESAEVMAKAGNISIDQVKKWFSNRRQRNGNTKTISEIARRRKRIRTLSQDDILLESAKMARLH